MSASMIFPVSWMILSSSSVTPPGSHFHCGRRLKAIGWGVPVTRSTSSGVGWSRNRSGRSSRRRLWSSSASIWSRPAPETDWYVQTTARRMGTTACSGASAMRIVIVEQFGLAMIPRCPLSARRLISGIPSGTSGSMRNVELLSITTVPDAAAARPKRSLAPSPPPKKAIWTPRSASSVVSAMVWGCPRNATVRPAERAVAVTRSDATGNARSSSTRSTVCPTAPVAPTTATRYPAIPCPPRLQLEHVLQPFHQMPQTADPLDRQHQPRHEGLLARGIVPDGQGLPRAAEDDLLVGHQPRQPHAVDGHPRDGRAAGPRGFHRLLHGRRRRGPPGGGDEARGPGRRARRRVALAVVVQLDDLHMGKIPRRPPGELHHQHGAQRKIGS